VSTVVQCWQAWLVENRNGAQGSGCPRRTPDKQDRHLRFLAFRDHHMSSSSVAPAWYNVMGGLISMPTIYHRIRSWGLHSYRPHLVLPLTCELRRQRLDWCRERINWDAEWNVVVFSDEFRFYLGMHDGRQRGRRLGGERHNAAYSVERHVGSYLLREQTSSDFYPEFNDCPTRRYVQEVLQPVLVPYVQEILKVRYQQDNARAYIASVSLEC
jgi:hypothetical protein